MLIRPEAVPLIILDKSAFLEDRTVVAFFGVNLINDLYFDGAQWVEASGYEALNAREIRR